MNCSLFQKYNGDFEIMDVIEKMRDWASEYLRRFMPGFYTQHGECYEPRLKKCWRRLLIIIKNKKKWENKVHLLDYLVGKNKSLQNMPDSKNIPSSGSYKRILIGLEKTFKKTGYEGFLIHWREGARTPIHEHPSFAYYKVIQGKFRMNFYDLGDGGHLIHRGKRIFQAGESIHSLENGHHNSHFIHKVECLKDGRTFHLYSSNSQKSRVFY